MEASHIQESEIRTGCFLFNPNFIMDIKTTIIYVVNDVAHFRPRNINKKYG